MADALDKLEAAEGATLASLMRIPGLDRITEELRAGRALFALAREYLWSLPVIALLAVISSLFEGIGLTLVIPLVQSLGDSSAPIISRGYVGFLHDFMSRFPADTRTVMALAMIFGAVLVKGVFNYANMALLCAVYQRISHKLRSEVYRRVLGMPLAQVERQPSGILLNSLNQETWRAADALNVIFVTISSLATAIVFVTLLVLISWKLALIAIGCLMLIPLAVQLISRRAKQMSVLGLDANEAMAQQVWSTLSGLRTIHIFGREEYEHQRFRDLSENTRALFLKMSLVDTTIGPMTEIMVVGTLAVLILLVNADVVTLSTLVAFIALLYRLQPRLVSLASTQSSFGYLHASITSVSAILEQDDGRALGVNPPAESFAGPISFRHVTFRYPGARTPAVEDLSFDLPQAGLVAIAGASGAGKSTVIDLLVGFQTPDMGEIRIGEVILTKAHAVAWRRRVGLVNQDPYVFDDTVRANILYGRPEASEAELVEAARSAAAHDFIEAMPQGYDTRVGERATQLSGGQRQRIALARALLRNPAMLVLDEATNALDPATERAFQATLKAFARDRLVVVVAHKLSTLVIADHVVVLQESRLIEQGAPGPLLRSGGPFARLFGSAAVEAIDPSRVAGGARS